MNIELDVKVTDNITGFSERVEKRLSAVVRRAAAKVEREAKKSIKTGEKSGRTYKRGKKTHQASAAGEAPATDIGLLANSIVTDMQPGALEAVVVASAEYAADLEFGTRTMAARPYMAPALEKVRTEFIEDCQRVMSEEA